MGVRGLVFAMATFEPDSVPTALRRLLEPGERLLWHARPRAYPAVLDAALTLIARLVLPLAALLLAWTFVDRGERAALADVIERAAWAAALPPLEIRLIGMLLGLALVASLVGGVLGALARLGVALVRSLDTLYAVTDRRLLVIERGHVTSLRRVSLLRLQRGSLGDDLHLGQGIVLRGLLDGDTVKRWMLPFLATRDDLPARQSAAFSVMSMPG